MKKAFGLCFISCLLVPLTSLAAPVDPEPEPAAHAEAICCIAYKPDGLVFATGSWDKSIRIWNGETGACVATLTGHEDRITDLEYSPDGKLLASSGQDGAVMLWSTDLSQKPEPVKLLDPNHKLISADAISFNPDGSLLAVATSLMVRSDNRAGFVRLWNTSKRESVDVLKGHLGGDVVSVDFAPDGKSLASATYEELVIWDLAKKQQLWSFTEEGARLSCVCFDPRGSSLCLVADGVPHFFEPGAGRRLQEWGLAMPRDEDQNQVEYSADGSLLAMFGDTREVVLWDTETSLRRSLSEPVEEADCVAFHPDGKTVAAADGKSPVLRSLKLAHKYQDFGRHHLQFVLSNDDKFAAYRDDTSFEIVSVMESKLLHRMAFERSEDFPTFIEFSHDGAVIASAHQGGHITLWEIESGKRLHQLTSPALARPHEYVMCIAWNAQGTLLAAGSEYLIEIWDIAKQKIVHTIQHRQEDLADLKFLQDDKKILAIGDTEYSGATRIWHISD